MAAALTVWVGLPKAFEILQIAFGVGAIVGLVLIAAGRFSRKSMIPFGPFLAFGAVCVWFWPSLISNIGIF